MKNAILLVVSALFISIASYSQSTVDSIEAKYKLLPMPEGGTTLEKTFPILGTYQLASTNNNSTGDLIITLDSTNKGIVWIDGLPEGRVKAYLMQSPATYRIIPQKSATGKWVPEGTMIFNTESNALNISLGAPYNQADPGSIFQNESNGSDVAVSHSSAVKVKTKTATSKSKSRVMYYSASKTLTTSSSNAAQQ